MGHRIKTGVYISLLNSAFPGILAWIGHDTPLKEGDFLDDILGQHDQSAGLGPSGTSFEYGMQVIKDEVKKEYPTSTPEVKFIISEAYRREF